MNEQQPLNYRFNNFDKQTCTNAGLIMFEETNTPQFITEELLQNTRTNYVKKRKIQIKKKLHQTINTNLQVHHAQIETNSGNTCRESQQSLTWHSRLTSQSSNKL